MKLGSKKKKKIHYALLKAKHKQRKINQRLLDTQIAQGINFKLNLLLISEPSICLFIVTLIKFERFNLKVVQYELTCK